MNTPHMRAGAFLSLLLLASLPAAAQPATGVTPRWAFTTLSSATAGDILSSPAVGPDGTVYFGVEVGSAAGLTTTGSLFALNRDGSQRWRYDVPDWVDSTPAVALDGTITFGCWDGRVYSLRPDGTLKWSFKTGGYVASSPAIGGDGTIYVGSGDGNLYALNPDGTEKWSSPAADWIDSSPAIGPDGTVYVGSWDNSLYAFASDGVERWHFPTLGDVVSSPALGGDGTVYIASRDHGVYAVDPAGAQKWRFDAGGSVEASPVLGADGTVYIGSTDGHLYALTPSGVERWRYPAAGQTALHSIYSTAAVRSDGTILFGTSDNALYALNADGTLAWTQALGDWCDSSPVVAGDGSVYVGCSDKRLYAFDGTVSAPLSEWPQAHRDSRRSGAQVFGKVSGTTGRLVNLSTRAVAGSDANTLITGFVVAGGGSRSLLLRGIGPTLGAFGVAGVLADPHLTAFAGASAVATNDNWADNGGVATLSPLFASVGAFGLEAASLDAGLAVSVSGGNYSAHVGGNGSASGAALMELYDSGGDANTRLINLSARCHVGTGGNILIAGFVVGGGSRTLLVRAAGPTLGVFGVEGTLANPRVQLFQGQNLIAENDDWGTFSSPAFSGACAADVGAFGFGTGSMDSMLVVTLPAGAYTAQVTGAGSTEGVALVEVYEVP